MFFNAPGKPTKFKQALYLTAAVILGVLLSLIANVFIEIYYLNWAMDQGVTVVLYNGYALSPALSYGLFLGGAILGFIFGRNWWRWVYVDRVWEKKYKNKK